MRVRFQAVATTTIIETWEAEVPDGTDEAAVEASLLALLDDGKCEFVDLENDGEDRRIISGSVEEA